MKTYAVTVEYETVAPLYQVEEFHFETEEEALLFKSRARRQRWKASEPRVVIREVFCPDSAMGWIIDEIEAVKINVLSKPAEYPSHVRAKVRSS